MSDQEIPKVRDPEQLTAGQLIRLLQQIPEDAAMWLEGYNSCIAMPRAVLYDSSDNTALIEIIGGF